MNFWLEGGVSLVIIFAVLYLCYIIIPKNQRVRDFFIRNQKYFSPNCISSWRMYLGGPIIIAYIYGMTVENSYIIYIAIWSFMFLAITDLLDGIVARYCDLETPEGASLDAKADKWFDLPALFAFSFFPVFEPIYLLFFIGIASFDIIGQSIRGRNSPPEAGIFGKAKTTVKFTVIYLMIMNGRYPEIYNLLKLEIIILILLFAALLLAGVSMGMKTLWYQEYLRKYLKEYF
jgi:phosphatidylglycerophosphate synthase